MTANYYFAIVGHTDNPLFEIEFNNSGKDAKVHHFYRLYLSSMIQLFADCIQQYENILII